MIETPRWDGEGVEALAREWRDLEERADCSFFQSWTWVGCRLTERFTSPVLVRALEGGETVGLALFNRERLSLAPRALRLHETGLAAEDSVFVEYNAPLALAENRAVIGAMLRVALAEAGVLVLSGVTQAVANVARSLGRVSVTAERLAIAAALNGDPALWLGARGAATRAQLARSRRRLERAGSLHVEQAQDLPQALGFLNDLAGLHQQSWRKRGHEGAFAEPAFHKFHEQIVRTGFPRQEVQLWRITTGVDVVGYLYNFTWRGDVLAYQSGFNTVDRQHASPGLLSHALAISSAAERGFRRYNFLAGDARYKRELGSETEPLYWIEVASNLHPRGLYRELKARTQGLRGC